MITDKVNLLDITEKLKYVKNCPLSEQSFYFYIWNGIRNKKIFTYASYDNGKMNGCLILSLERDLNPDLILYLIFVWIDKKFPKLWIEYVKFVEEKAKELGAKRILINTKRNAKSIEKKLGKYGYKQKYVIFERNVK